MVGIDGWKLAQTGGGGCPRLFPILGIKYDEAWEDIKNEFIEGITGADNCDCCGVSCCCWDAWIQSLKVMNQTKVRNIG